MKKKYMLMGVAAALITTTIIGGSLAAIQVNGEDVRQDINTRSLSIELTGSGTAEGNLYLENAMPGGVIDKDIKIENTADTPLYARVTIRKYWGDYESGSIELTKDYSKDTDKISLEVNGEWLEDKNAGDGGETSVYYYRKPIEPGTEPVDILKSLKLDADLDNSYADKGIGLEVEVEAVQTYAAQVAMLSEWGIWADIDENGTIINIEE